MELILKISQNDLSSVPYIFALKVLRLSSTVFHLLGKNKKVLFCKIIWILPIIKVIWNGCIVIKKIEVKKNWLESSKYLEFTVIHLLNHFKSFYLFV